MESRINTPAQFPTIRRALLRLHADLFTIHSRVNRWAGYYPQRLTNLEKLTIVLEDRRFTSHHGVDWVSVVRECWRALTFRRHGGASTIDMQFVRTCTGYRERTMRRKLYEIFLSLVIQFRYSKIVILRSYLDVAFFGSRLYGARRAAKKMFGKRHEDLTVEEAAMLASMLVYPRPIGAPDNWRLRIERRAQYGMAVYVRYKDRLDKLPIGVFS